MENNRIPNREELVRKIKELLSDGKKLKFISIFENLGKFHKDYFRSWKYGENNFRAFLDTYTIGTGKNNKLNKPPFMEKEKYSKDTFYKLISIEQDDLNYNELFENIIDGKKVLKKQKEILIRNPSIKEWKKLYLKSNDNCEFCNMKFSFFVKGEKQSILESHHLKPFSNFTDSTILNRDDIAFICPNCHRLIHSLKNNNELFNLNKSKQKELILNLKKLK